MSDDHTVFAVVDGGVRLHGAFNSEANAAESARKGSDVGPTFYVNDADVGELRRYIAVLEAGLCSVDELLDALCVDIDDGDFLAMTEPGFRWFGGESTERDADTEFDCVVEIGSARFIVLTAEERDQAAVASVIGSLWAFNNRFIESRCGLDSGTLDGTEDQCERRQRLIEGLVKGLGGGLIEFAEEALRCDGHGHFLSSYDGEEHEVTVDGVTFYVYRD